jgi:CRISPR/Cas system-associated endonuclease Cas3-HD
MHCYAYRSKDSKGKSLEEPFFKHSIDVAKCATGAKDINIRCNDVETLFVKASKVLGVDIEVVRKFVTIAALLHDIAKIFKELQKPCFESESCTSFENHDVESAWFLYHMGSELKYIPQSIRFENIATEIILRPPQAYNDTFRKTLAYVALVVFPVLLHNYAIASPWRILGVHPKRSYTRKIYEKCHDDLEELSKYLEEQGIEDVANYLKQVAMREALELIPFDSYTVLKVVLPNPSEVITLIEAVTGLINFCDGRIASQARRGR